MSEERTDFLAILESRKADIAAACVAGMSPQRLYKLAQQAYARVPRLRECSADSIYLAVLHCAETGLEPGPMQHAAIVPYRNRKTGRYEAQFQAMYRGLLYLARKSSVIKAVHCDVVYDGDEFRYYTDEGGRHLFHRPTLLDDKERRITHAYMVAEIDGSKPQIEVMTYAQLEAIRRRAKAGDEGAWQTDTPEMYRKTVFKRGSKWLPLSVEAVSAIAIDNENEGGDARELSAWKPAQALALAGGMVSLGAKPEGDAALPPAEDEQQPPLSDDPLPTEEAELLPLLPPAAEPSGESELGSSYDEAEEAARVAYWKTRFEASPSVKDLTDAMNQLGRIEGRNALVYKSAVAHYNAAIAAMKKKR